MVAVGQQMHGSFAEAMDEVVVCVMSRADVRRLFLGDPRIATRIAETMGRRLGQLEERLSDAVFKSVPERLASTVATLAEGRGWLHGGQLRITHEQLAALAGTSRETTTKVLGCHHSGMRPTLWARWFWPILGGRTRHVALPGAVVAARSC